MNYKLLSWNGRKLDDRSKLKIESEELAQIIELNLGCFQETKLENITKLGFIVLPY